MQYQPLNPIDGMTVELEDRGQDFLELDIQHGRIVTARPFQHGVWSGRVVVNEALSVGDRIALQLEGGVRTLLYPVVAVRPMESTRATENSGTEGSQPVQIGPLDV